MSIKSIKVDGVSHKIDYDALENKPIIPAGPKEIRIINFAVDTDKDDGRPKKDHAYAGGKIDSIEIFRYACPERIDIDSTVDTEGDKLDEPETHLSYWKDGRAIYARDGDFGYPEIDGTGQFNFRPNFNVSGYILKPVVTDFSGKPHNDTKKIGDDPNPDYNPCYNNFKTPWLTGIDGLYRFTKVCKDIRIEMQAVLESSLPRNTVTYRIIAPSDYAEANIPSVRVFRCSDQAEKYFKYYLHPNTYETLNQDLMSGELLTFTKLETEEGEDQVWEATGISYDDATGYPSNASAKVTFLVDKSNVVEGYTVSESKSGSVKNLNAGDFGETKVLTGITGDATVTIRIAPPVSVAYLDQGYTEYDQADPTKVVYGYEEGNPESVAQGSDFVFTVVHGYEYEETKPLLDDLGNPVLNDKGKAQSYVVKDDLSEFTVSDAVALLDEILVSGEPIANIEEAIAITKLSFTKKKAKITVKGAYVTGPITIKLAQKPVYEAEEEPAEEPAPEQGN